ncbi:MAG: M56 family metallopeptidase, partial [Defluviitaleaceae bacterium]|nr:M56 family metallopeptidase [Defluviitaleaceae bacterium]
CLWAVAGIRLTLPFSIDSIWSPVPFGAQPIAVDTIATVISDTGATSTSLANTLITVGGFIWIIGAVIMFGYGVVSYFILKHKLQKSAHQYENVFEGADIKSPYVLGFISPNIYLPLGLSDSERKYVILHEQIHIRRFDHFTKFAAYLILSFHWFNPFVWLAFNLMCRDMEMSCDEHVLSKMGIEESKEAYSMALVTLAIDKPLIAGSPLAFGGGDAKARVKNVLGFKKYSKLAGAAKVILVIALSVGLLTNTARASIPGDLQEESIWPIYPTFSCCTGESYWW